MFTNTVVVARQYTVQISWVHNWNEKIACKAQECQRHQASPILCPADQSMDACLTYLYADSPVSSSIETSIILQCAGVLPTAGWLPCCY